MVEFFVVVEGGYAPIPADPSAMGRLPTAAFRYCEPVRTASRFGWYVFLPEQLSLIWEEDNFFWSLDNFETRYLLSDAIQYPHFSDRFDAAAPESDEGYAPPFLSRTNDEDIVQIWTGLFARTPPGHGLWVRGPVNLAQQSAFTVLEGVVETDWWFGPLFANVRIERRDTPIVFRQTRPFLQVMPFDKELGQETAKAMPAVHLGLDTLGKAEWDAYRQTVVKRMKTPHPPGDYAVMARKGGPQD
ncbi:DUF6065 family protein [Cognatiyoonia sp. IB215182]|uniref:DUF6065 family protein n=1 Tax=Cognatiyoonia sp. IB215182 TaxID=3097353 RepID=UPI002A1368D4|nr:DUF6065 family protein [Cognatiyoonia sp. IB215182]MDX8351016.1 DUF6065 family protein [Cognatiyoonia sp. IB215182]